MPEQNQEQTDESQASTPPPPTPSPTPSPTPPPDRTDHDLLGYIEKGGGQPSEENTITRVIVPEEGPNVIRRSITPDTK